MFLVVIKGPYIGKTYQLNKIGPIIVGRERECDVKVLDVMVSRKHCQIEKRNDIFYVKDLDSTNKTFINRKIVKAEQGLKEGDLIEIGDIVLLFTYQKELSVRTVEDYKNILMKQTRKIDFPANDGTSNNPKKDDD